MNLYPDPREYLIAFGIAFVAGVLTTLGIGAYTRYIERDGTDRF